MKSTLTRVASVLTFRSCEWDLHQGRQIALVLCVFVSSIGAIVTLHGWWLGQNSLWKPVLWALPALLLLAITSDRRILAGTVLVVYAGYGVRGLVLGQTAGYWLVGISAVLIFLIVITAPSKK
jgi:hypothetical protein